MKRTTLNRSHFLELAQWGLIVAVGATFFSLLQLRDDFPWGLWV